MLSAPLFVLSVCPKTSGCPTAALLGLMMPPPLFVLSVCPRTTTVACVIPEPGSKITCEVSAGVYTSNVQRASLPCLDWDI